MFCTKLLCNVYYDVLVDRVSFSANFLGGERKDEGVSGERAGSMHIIALLLPIAKVGIADLYKINL